jgi:hypothetical protein
MTMPRYQIHVGSFEHDRLRQDPLAESLEERIWAQIAEAAIHVGCSAEVAEQHYDYSLESRRPTEMQRDYRPSRHDVDEIGRLLYPQEPEEMRREYRAALRKLRDVGVDYHEAMLKDLAAGARADKARG